MNGAHCSDLSVKPFDGPSESGPTVHERSVGTSSLVIKVDITVAGSQCSAAG